jgi:hypothetical protein
MKNNTIKGECVITCDGDGSEFVIRGNICVYDNEDGTWTLGTGDDAEFRTPDGLRTSRQGRYVVKAAHEPFNIDIAGGAPGFDATDPEVYAQLCEQGAFAP